MFVTLERAMEVTLGLARENILDKKEAMDSDLCDQREEQVASVETIEDFFTNHWIREDK